MWEPVVDAAAVLGAEGLTGRCSDPMAAALRKLHAARNWNQVRAALLEVHRLAHGDLPFLPLWQTAKHYAFRRTLSGLPEETVQLYSDVASWRKRAAPARRTAAN